MSSKRARRRRSCTGKVRHPHFMAADRAMHALLRKRGSDGRMEVYRCRFCGGFHFGHAAAFSVPRSRLLALLERL